MTLKEVKDGVQELIEDSAAQKVREKAKERRKFLQWMSTVSCDDKHATCHGQRNHGTARWIFHIDEYKTWNTSDHAFIWLNGQPGHGKTILASSVIDEIQGSGEAEPQTLGYFYCNFRDDRTTNAAAVLRSLVAQLLQQSRDDWITKIREPGPQEEGDLTSLRNLWQLHSNKKPHPTDLGYLRKLLVEASTLVRRPVLVIDALDECKDYSDLVRHLVNLAEDALLRLFVTSRSEQDIKKAFHHLPTVSLGDSVKQMKADIDLHIAEQLKTQERLSGLRKTLRTTIFNKLSEKAKGMFRWVQCQLDVLMKCKTSGSIQKALDDLPKDLHETYDRILHSIEERGGDDGPISQRCLLLLAGTFTPLTLDQLDEAMMIEVGCPSLNEDLRVLNTMDIVAACGSLVTYNEKTSVVALSHYSVKEYLISRPNNICKSVSDMHARICELLITYVLCNFVDEICAKLELEDKRLATQHQSYWPPHANVADISKDHPLLSYAIQGWKHLEHVSDEDPYIMTALSRLNSEFLRNTKKHRVLATAERRAIGDALMWLRADVTLPSLLFIPLFHGMPWMVEFIVKRHPHLLHEDIAPHWGSPLIFAIAEKPDFLGILLKLGVDLNKLSSFQHGTYRSCWVSFPQYAPITWATAIGREDIVDFLLSQREVDVPDNIMYVAVNASELSTEIIRKLCQRRVDGYPATYGSTPLHAFLSRLDYHNIRTQWLPIVQALVEPSCDLSLQDRTARTALHIALDQYMKDVVVYLLDHNAGLSATATLHPNMWSFSKNETWFPKVEAMALAAGRPYTRVKGKVVNATMKSQLVEFSVAVTADGDNPHPVCAVVVSAVLNGWTFSYKYFSADLSYCNQSLQKDIQDSPKDDSSRLKLHFLWESGKNHVCSRLFDYHQEAKVTRMLQHLNEDKDSIGTSVFLQTSEDERNTEVFKLGVEFILDIYRGPLP
ncbi:hypothetical protein DFJ58DRAFT_749655 [Suillus subalutaceus]|uniref:uncharacterized protein n=1 Tax=Suillus subalutaceus TaxID=48586 RepID=UPI001B8746FA|nr:uncharacterized protein DFJ58DRAFT_749655 [Suillus subalutaceus]KAG1836889.1 hypothetical protein DFJ58DRAFT_749655 [Suillus subalutaceus]